MAAGLPNSTSPNWNILTKSDQDNDRDENVAFYSSPTNSSFRTFSSVGGGDAPTPRSFFTPRVRSQLFTISTRAVMTSTTSQINFTAAGGVGTGKDHTLQNVSSSSSVDSNIEEITARCDVKPLNTDVCAFSSFTPATVTCSKPKVEGKEESSNESHRVHMLSRSKRCIHGSFEDLLSLRRISDARNILNGNRRKSAPAVVPSTSRRGQMMEATNALLVEENKYLTQTIQKLKKKLIVSKIATLFTLAAVKRRGKVIKAVEGQKMDKDRQCAARLILHSLLLNCWRNTKRELDMRLSDNADLRKSVENFALQVQVLRHVQTGERQKAQEKASIIKNLEEELKVIMEESKMMRKEMEKMESELNSLQASSQNLIDENKVLSAEIVKMIDTKDKLMQSLDWERLRAQQFSKENVTMKEKLLTFDDELKEATEQKTHWQERARCSESECWELQLNIETKNNSICELTASCESLRAEKKSLIDMKCQLKRNLDRTSAELQALIEKNNKLTEINEAMKAERDAKAEKIHEMEMALSTSKQEFSEIEKELFSYKLRNVRKRREWGNALYFIVSPMDAVRRKRM